jgi:hypothetical protein
MERNEGKTLEAIERPAQYADEPASDFELAVRFAKNLAPIYAADSEVRFALSILARSGVVPGIEDDTLSQFTIHQPDAAALYMGLVAAEAVRYLADDPNIDATTGSYLKGARDALYDLTKKLVATRLELEKATADQEELAALRNESALLNALEAEALADPLYLHNGTEEALMNRKSARGLGFGPAIGRTLREALAGFVNNPRRSA